ncbi:MAG TPA: L-2-hydroxyglutarate oxidase [Candidatus Krumholzibacteria bacterium]|nr:L-2-hydroxyglutarate oxidase [Candidatus Krumholzibacteria bacterium]
MPASSNGSHTRFLRDTHIVIVGAGIVGLATAWQLQRRRPGVRVTILEKEAEVASHQSGHNSGVLHAGLYYRPGSLKAQLCVDGKREMEAFARSHGVPFRTCGKLVVAVAQRELPALDALARRAAANGIQLEEIAPERMREIEPAVCGVRALYSPATGVIDFRDVARALVRDIEDAGGTVTTGRRVTGIHELPDAIVVDTDAGDVTGDCVITCAGLHSDRLAAMTGHRDGVHVVPVRGDYYTLSARAAGWVRALIYPVPDPTNPFLGVHFTRTIHDAVLAGPNAVLALAREGYRRRDVSARDLLELAAFPGAWRMALSNVATSVGEAWRDVSRRAFAAALRRYVPELSDGDLTFGPSGVRAQAVDRHGSFLDDFSFGGSGRVLHVRNAPSPAATASLTIGRHLADEAGRRFATFLT